jgi:iron complex transport system ATP-binding protein
MLAIENVAAGYGDKLVLRDVSAEIRRGEFFGLIGPNGCGKTTLLRVLSGVLHPSNGQTRLLGRDLRVIGRRDVAKTLAYLLQDVALDLGFTVREVALMGRSPHLPKFGRETRRDVEIAQRAMQLADVAELADRPVTEISGGERQRALIAMCLAQQPEILLLDEPTNHLDIGHQLSVLDLIRKLNGHTGMTVVAVFHDLNLAAEYCHRLLVLNGGRIAAIGSPHEVLTQETIEKVYGVSVLVDRNPLSGKPHIVLTAGVNGEREPTGHAQ